MSWSFCNKLRLWGKMAAFVDRGQSRGEFTLEFKKIGEFVTLSVEFEFTWLPESRIDLGRYHNSREPQRTLYPHLYFSQLMAENGSFLCEKNHSISFTFDSLNCPIRSCIGLLGLLYHHKLGGMDNRNVLSCGFGVWNQDDGRFGFFWRLRGRARSMPLSQLLGFVGNLWTFLACSLLPLSSHSNLPVCMSVSKFLRTPVMLD